MFTLQARACILSLGFTLVLYGSMFFMVWSTPNLVITLPCLQTRAWVLSLGFTLAYGSMFSKVWTIYRVTTRRKKDIKVGRVSVRITPSISCSACVLTEWLIIYWDKVAVEGHLVRKLTWLWSWPIYTLVWPRFPRACTVTGGFCMVTEKRAFMNV